MKFGIAIPTFADSAYRLERLFESVKEFTLGIDYEIYVCDGGTPNVEHIAKQDFVCGQAGGTHIKVGDWVPGAMTLDALGWHALKQGCDVIVFLSDDCLVSQGWLHPIKYYYEWNENLKPGIVSTMFVEAWEMAMNKLLGTQFHFYDWTNEGDLTREQLTFTQELYDEAKASGRIVHGTFDPPGPIVDGKFKLEHPLSVSGGVGPCFTISAEAFKAVNGFEKCEYIGDYEAMIGFKVVDAGYICALIPGPPVYHARGVATSHLNDLIGLLNVDPYRPWTDEATDRFVRVWGAPFPEYQKDFDSKIHSQEKVKNSRFIRYQSNRFPINIEYDNLNEINLGPIHWRDKRQQERMRWIASNCQGSEDNFVLDIGCANGGLIEFIKLRDDQKYTGVDLDRVRIDEAKATHPKEQFYVLDACYGLPINFGTFDVVVCADCLEHIPRGKASDLLKELCRVSQKKVLITLPISEETIPNLDHVWSPSKDNIQQFLQPTEEEWYIEIVFVEDFALIKLEKK